MNTYLRPRWTVRLVTLVLLGSLLAMAGDPPVGTVRFEGLIVVEPNGDARSRLILDLSPPDYRQVRESNPDPRRVLRPIAGIRPDREQAPDTSLRYDEASTALVAETHDLGAARSVAAGEWAIAVPPACQYVTSKEQDGVASAFFFAVGKTPFGLPYQGVLEVRLPVGASAPRWDEGAALLKWMQPPAPDGGTARLVVDLRTRDKLLSGIYKVYGLPESFPEQWVARAVLRNEGDGAARDFQARFRIGGYAEWGAWIRVAVVVPGQTVVLPYYPLLDRSVVDLRASTPAEVEIEWRHAAGDGTETKRITFLGGREFVFSEIAPDEDLKTRQDEDSNAPFIAAWVSRDDPVVKEFAGMAARNAGGAGAQVTPEKAMRVVRACYELMVLNDFAYKSPPYIVDPKIRFDARLVQNVKYPRDVIRDKSGTCIDLAILQASMWHTLGLKPYLAFIPGHVFPVVEISGNLSAVEATGIRGGTGDRILTFDEALSQGNAELKTTYEKKTLVLVDLHAEWGRGIANPELDSLPPDVLKQWGIRAKGVAGGLMPEDAARAEDPAGYAGTWSGNLAEQVDEGQTAPLPATMRIQLEDEGKYKLFVRVEVEMTRGDQKAHLRIEQEIIGEEMDGQLVFQGTSKVATNLETGETIDLEPSRGMARLEGGLLVGRYGNDALGFVEFSLSK